MANRNEHKQLSLLLLLSYFIIIVIFYCYCHILLLLSHILLLLYYLNYIRCGCCTSLFVRVPNVTSLSLIISVYDSCLIVCARLCMYVRYPPPNNYFRYREQPFQVSWTTIILCIPNNFSLITKNSNFCFIFYFTNAQHSDVVSQIFWENTTKRLKKKKKY